MDGVRHLLTERLLGECIIEFPESLGYHDGSIDAFGRTRGFGSINATTNAALHQEHTVECFDRQGTR